MEVVLRAGWRGSCVVFGIPRESIALGAAEQVLPLGNLPLRRGAASRELGEFMAKVLIVDDEPTTRFLIRRFVHDLGHWVVESSNGRRAWDLLWDNRDIDLLITDLLMPELSGQGLIQMVRSSVDLRRLPIVVITADSEANELDYLTNLGASAFARKPITPAIRQIIQRVLLPGQLPAARELIG